MLTAWNRDHFRSVLKKIKKNKGATMEGRGGLDPNR